MPHRNRIFVNHVFGLGDLDIYEHIGWNKEKDSKDYSPMSSNSHIQIVIGKYGVRWSMDLFENDVEKLIGVLKNYLGLFAHKGE